MAPSNPYRCCVCGKETSQRCGPCGAAGVTTAFCSRDCQKLVHFVHKQVCGKNAQPFRFPPLSENEVISAITYAPHLADMGGGYRVSLNERLWDTVACKEEDVPELIASLGAGNESKLSPLETAWVTCEIRQFIHRRAIISHKKHFDSAHSKLSTIPGPLEMHAFVASRLNDQPADDTPFFPIEEEWYVRLMHHILIASAITSYFFSPDILDDQTKLNKSDEVGRFRLPASLPIRAVIREVSERDTELATRICESLELLEACGCGPFKDLKPPTGGRGGKRE